MTVNNNEFNNQQTSIDLTTWAQEYCELKNSCRLTGTSGSLGDPCPGVEKYTRVRYSCISGESDLAYHRFKVDTIFLVDDVEKVAYLYSGEQSKPPICNDDEFIRIKDATFGNIDDEQCDKRETCYVTLDPIHLRNETCTSRNDSKISFFVVLRRIPRHITHYFEMRITQYSNYYFLLLSV